MCVVLVGTRRDRCVVALIYSVVLPWSGHYPLRSNSG